jgi:hypothetical protein
MLIDRNEGVTRKAEDLVKRIAPSLYFHNTSSWRTVHNLVVIERKEQPTRKDDSSRSPVLSHEIPLY